MLDPAVGSGAFPMGVLHKLTLALRRLDLDNTRWEALQKELAGQKAADAFDTSGHQERNEQLAEISEIFEHYKDSDFGRKLYLIQNSIYGVDIQPIATQIAKLRIFISLAIEQQPEPTADNFGIQPLPNLETRFVAADTLLGLERPTQLSLGQTASVNELKQKLHDNRERYFHANSRQRKLACRQEDAQLRQKLADALRVTGFPAADADKVAAWDPYNQNSKSDWFDMEYMFGVTDGFDVVIGNPPYVQLQKDSGRLRKLYQARGFTTFTSTGDIYQLFYEQGCRLLRSLGLLAYITSNSWLKAEYGKATRCYLGKKHTPLQLLEMGKDVFENVIVDASILVLREGRSVKDPSAFPAVDTDKLTDKSFPPASKLWGWVRLEGDAPWSVLSLLEQSVLDKIRAKGIPLKDWDIAINYGIKTGFNEAFIIDNQTKDALVADDPRSAEIIKPVLRGRDIRRYRARWANIWLIDTHNGYDGVPAIDIDDYPAIKAHLDGHYEQLEKRYDKGETPYNLRNCAYHADFRRPKLFWADMAKAGRFAFSEKEAYCNNKGYILTGTSLKYLLAVLNSSLITWWVSSTAATTGMGLTEWTIVTVERIPIPKASDIEQRPLVALVNRILSASDTDLSSARARALQAEIDRLVYRLYGLSGEEIRMVGDSTT